MNLLEVRNLTKHFGGVRAVNNLSFTVKEKSITALIGPNGCGKTTAFNLITGFENKDAGEILYKQQPLTTKPHRVAQQLARTFQHPRLFSNLTVYEHLQLALNKDDDKLISLFSTETDWKKQAQQALETVGFNNTLTTKAQDLSYGQKKLLELALAIAKNTDIILLDEPVAGVNPALREQIQRVLKTLQEQNKTILLIEHDMNFVSTVADTVHVMNQGSLLKTGTPKQIQEDKEVLEAYLGA
ncbi:MAG: ABC transporter ATP-binding protein [Candidatus Woesearchaeota archaeon]